MAGIRARQVNVPGFVVDIPDGWRDSIEVPSAHETVGGTGNHKLVHEAGDAGTIEIAVGRYTVVGDAACKAAADYANAHNAAHGVLFQDAEAATFDGDAGCVMNIRGVVHGSMWLRSHGDKSVGVVCMGQGAELDRACNEVRSRVRTD